MFLLEMTRAICYRPALGDKKTLIQPLLGGSMCVIYLPILLDHLSHNLNLLKLNCMRFKWSDQRLRCVICRFPWSRRVSYRYSKEALMIDMYCVVNGNKFLEISEREVYVSPWTFFVQFIFHYCFIFYI